MNAKNNFEIREGTIENVQPCFALLKLRILSLIAALSSSQHSLALRYERICMCGVYTT